MHDRPVYFNQDIIRRTPPLSGGALTVSGLAAERRTAASRDYRLEPDRHADAQRRARIGKRHSFRSAYRGSRLQSRHTGCSYDFVTRIIGALHPRVGAVKQATTPCSRLFAKASASGGYNFSTSTPCAPGPSMKKNAYDRPEAGSRRFRAHQSSGFFTAGSTPQRDSRRRSLPSATSRSSPTRPMCRSRASRASCCSSPSPA